jgi:spore coat polysaccharide biosynthesis predicted glycosyltransferase SpsG
MSGADRSNMTRAAAAAAVAAGIPADVVVGAAYPFETDLRRWMQHQPLLKLHVNVPWMAKLMAKADLAIGAPSSASWERCTLGLPTVLVTLADNQREAAKLLADAGAAVALGWHETVSTADMQSALSELTAHPERVRAMSEASARITDGRGTVRVADELDRLVEKGFVLSQGEGE